MSSHLPLLSIQQVDEMLRFYLSSRAWFDFRIFSCGSKLHMLQTLSFMQTPFQHLACDSSNTIVQLTCLHLA